jgi:HK97 family phage major capsid protein
MNVDTKPLYEKKATAWERQKQIVNDAISDAKEKGVENPEVNFTLSEEKEKEFNEWEKEWNEAEKKIKTLETVSEKEEDKEEKAYKEGKSTDQKDTEKEKYTKAFQDYMKNGERMSQESRDVLETVQRAQSAGTDSEGGHLIREEMAGEITRAMKQFGQVRRFADVRRTQTGADMQFPTIDDTSNKGELVNENTSASTQDVTVGNITMKAWIFNSKQVPVSRSLLQDDTLSFENELTSIFGERLGRITNEKYTTGAGHGSSEPEGYMTAASLGHTTSSATAFTRDEIYELIHSVDPDYRNMPGAAFAFTDATLKEIKKLSVGSSDARPLWQSGLAEGVPPTVDGYPYFINQEMKDSGTASNKFMAFGDFGRFRIRDVMQMEMLRLVERAAEKFQVIFIAYMRSDSRLIDAGGKPIKYMQHAAS